MVDIGLHRGASPASVLAAMGERAAGFANRIGRLRHALARAASLHAMRQGLDDRRLDDLGLQRGRGIERSVARMMRFGLR